MRLGSLIGSGLLSGSGLFIGSGLFTGSGLSIGSGLGSIGIIAVLPCSLLCDCDYHSCHPERSRRISLAYCVLCFRLQSCMSSFGSLSSLRMAGLCVRGCLLAQGF